LLNYIFKYTFYAIRQKSAFQLSKSYGRNVRTDVLTNYSEFNSNQFGVGNEDWERVWVY